VIKELRKISNGLARKNCNKLVTD